jgi:hypothetical protein
MPGPPHSLEPLALLALRESGADGYALYEMDRENGSARLIASYGLALPGPEEKGVYVVSLSLFADTRVFGILSFTFRSEIASRNASPLLARAAHAIEAVWRLAHLRRAYADAAARVGELEAALADSKIADRARGLLEGAAEPGSIGIMERHVEVVLRAARSGQALETAFRDLEDELEERRLTAVAKSILRQTYGMSEEQAHMHLRSLSRNSRRPLKEIARELIGAGAPA